ncbi:MAG: metal-dependent hydrolase [bacterium]|nr:metal-dependent hydrolase [bacterium]
MKGFTHFISATAVASCVPGAAQYAIDHTSFILLWGGVFGLLPDTLDFKFNRFFYKFDTLYEPAQEPDPEEIAAVVARHIERAQAEKRVVTLHLHTIKLGADLWRQYQIAFDTEQQQIHVEIGPIVNTGKVPIPGSEPREKHSATTPVACRFTQNYDTVTTVSIFSGPSFAFVPKPEGVDVQFLPWHRSWTHSLTLGALFGLIAWVIAALASGHWLYPAWMFGTVVTLGYWTHVVEDQFGFMGSNLLFPLTKERTPGFHTMRAMDPLPNFMTCWLSVALLFWNLSRTTSSFPQVELSGWAYVLYAVIIPVALMLFGRALMRPAEPQPAVTEARVPMPSPPRAGAPAPPEEDEEDEEPS